jgi:hypothetical protein
MKLTNQQCEDLAYFQERKETLRKLRAEVRTVEADIALTENHILKFLTRQNMSANNGEVIVSYKWQNRDGYTVKSRRFRKWKIEPIVETYANVSKGK